MRPLSLPVVRPPAPRPDWISAPRPTTSPLLDAPAPPVTPGGVEEGYAEGMRRAQADVQAVRAAAAAAVAQIAGLRSEVLIAAEQDLVDLALCIAREVVLHAVERERDLAKAMARAALSELTTGERVVLRVSRVDREEVEAWLRALPADPSRPEVTLVEDEALARGEVVAESRHGRVDARLEARLSQVARAVREGGVNGADAEET